MASLQDIFQGIIEPDFGGFSHTHELAQYVLGLKFTPEQIARYEELSYRHQDGGLTPTELEELDAYLTANTFLTVMQLKARRSLMQHSPAACASRLLTPADVRRSARYSLST